MRAGNFFARREILRLGRRQSKFHISGPRVTSQAATQARNTLCVEKDFGTYSLFEIQVYIDILNLVVELPDEV